MKIADISVYQGLVDWDKARKELELVIFRSSIGTSADGKYLTNAKNCQLPFGVYHYFKAGTATSAEKEATFFYNNAIKEGLKPLFFVLDIEYSTHTSSTTKPVCEAALKTLRSLGAKKVGLYISQSRYPYIKDIVDKFDFIWIPRYGNNTGSPNEKYLPVYNCDLWQYTDKGTVDGIKGNVDLNQVRTNKIRDIIFNKNTTIIVPTTEIPVEKLLRTLRKGMRGNDVKILQERLNKVLNAGLIADGIFGSKTFKALKDFQARNSLTQDGIYGPKTHSILLKKI